MQILNLFGGPCTGKSTTAAALFYHMKKMGIQCELIQEYAKDMVYERRHNILTDQIYVFAKQQRRIARLKDHNLDWVITDSPIPLGLIYLQPGALSENFHKLVMEVFDSYHNHNFLLSRNVAYNPVGRNQKFEHEAVEFDEKVKQLLEKHLIKYSNITGGEPAVDAILHLVGLLN
jgi:hypothetical protein